MSKARDRRSSGGERRGEVELGREAWSKSVRKEGRVLAPGRKPATRGDVGSFDAKRHALGSSVI